MLIYTIFSVVLICCNTVVQAQGYVPDASKNTRKQKLGYPKQVDKPPLTKQTLNSRSKSANQDYVASGLYSGSPPYLNSNVVKQFFDPGNNRNQVNSNNVEQRNKLGQNTNSVVPGQNQNGGKNRGFKEFQPTKNIWQSNKQKQWNRNSITTEHKGAYQSSYIGNGIRDKTTQKNNRQSIKPSNVKKNTKPGRRPKPNSLYGGDDVVSNRLSAFIDQRRNGLSRWKGRKGRKGAGRNWKNSRSRGRTNSRRNRKRKLPLTKIEAHLKTELQKIINRYDRLRDLRSKRRKNNEVINPDLVDLYWLMNSISDD